MLSEMLSSSISPKIGHVIMRKLMTDIADTSRWILVLQRRRLSVRTVYCIQRSSSLHVEGSENRECSLPLNTDYLLLLLFRHMSK